MNQYILTKDIVFSEIINYFPNDFKITSLAENARSFYYYCKKKNIEKSAFFMLGSMGQELSMGLGVSIGMAGKTMNKCVVISSDGSFLSNTSSLFTIGVMKPKDLIIILLDNEKHHITGGQVTASKFISLFEVATTCHFSSHIVKNEDDLRKSFTIAKKDKNPVFIQVKINDTVPFSADIDELPVNIYRNFSRYITDNL